MPHLLRFLARVDDIATEHTGRWLLRYDPDYHLPNNEYDGGWLETTDNPLEAQRYPTAAEALEAWQSGPSCPAHRLRPDGRPNRPLTAYTVEVVDMAVLKPEPGRATLPAERREEAG